MTSLNVLAVGTDAGQMTAADPSLFPQHCTCFRPTAHGGSCRLLSPAVANAHPSWKRTARLCYYSVFQVSQRLGKNGVGIISFSIPSLFLSLCYWKGRKHSESNHFSFIKITFKSNCKEYFIFLPKELFFYLFLLFLTAKYTSLHGWRYTKNISSCFTKAFCFFKQIQVLFMLNW